MTNSGYMVVMPDNASLRSQVVRYGAEAAAGFLLKRVFESVRRRHARPSPASLPHSV
jgi:hypothetical protein